MSDKYFKLMIWEGITKTNSPICIENGVDSVFLCQEEIQKLVSFLILNKEKIGFKGEL
jgi:hypothetical protein